MAPLVVSMIVAAHGLGAVAQEDAGPGAYRLQPGDSVRVAVFGIEGLDVTSVVRSDGRLSAPLVGEVEAAGQVFEDVRRAIVGALDQRAFRFRTYSGGEAVTVIEGGEVFVEIASYRPVFVGGDVRRPGEQVYSPGLTVRQVLARAGGVDVLAGSGGDPLLSALEFDAQRQRVADRLTRLHAEMDQVRAELDGAETTAPPPGERPDEPAAMGTARAAEAAVANAETGLIAREDENLNSMVRLLSERVRILDMEVAARQQAEKLDRENEEEVRDRLSRGITQVTRLTEAQRAAVDSVARLRSTEAEMLEARRRIVEMQRQAERLGEERRVELSRDFRRLLAEIAQTEIELRAANAKLSYTGSLGRSLLEAQGLPYDVTVVRGGPAGTTITTAPPLDALVAPGDVVELRLRRIAD